MPPRCCMRNVVLIQVARGMLVGTGTKCNRLVGKDWPGW